MSIDPRDRPTSPANRSTASPAGGGARAAVRRGRSVRGQGREGVGNNEASGAVPPPAIWQRLVTLGSSSELGDVLGHLLDPGWEPVGPPEIGDAIAGAAAQAAVLDYLDWCFATPNPAGAEATPAVLDSVRKVAGTAAREAAPAIAKLGPDALALFEAVFGNVSDDHQVATAVVHAHLLLGHWRGWEAERKAAADPQPTADRPAQPTDPNESFNRARSLLRRRRGERHGRAIAQQRRDVALAAVLDGTLASLWGGRVWFGWTHELEGTVLARPYAEGQSLVELLRLLPSHPFPLHQGYAEERRRWQEAVLPGRYVDFEALLRPRRDRVMRGPDVTTFLQGLASEGRELDPDDLRRRLETLPQPAREGVWLYLYFNAGQLGPALLGQAGTLLQIALLEAVESGMCWSRAVAEAVLDDLAYHPPSESAAREDFVAEAPPQAAPEEAESGELLAAAPENPGPPEAQIPLAVRARAATIVGQRLLDDPELSDLLTDTRSYCTRPAVRQWLDTLAPQQASPVPGR